MVVAEVQLEHVFGPASWVVADLLWDCRPPLEASLPDVWAEP